MIEKLPIASISLCQVAIPRLKVTDTDRKNEAHKHYLGFSSRNEKARMNDSICTEFIKQAF